MWILAFLALSPHAGAAPAAHMHDAAFREGWSLLQEERYVEARAALGKIPPAEYDLGDYIAYFVGMGAARDGKRSEAGESLRTLEEKFPDSPLLPYLHHEVAYAAALDNDVAGARMALERSHGKVGGGYRKSEEGFVAAFLAEEGGPSPEAASLHLSNFAAYTAHEAAALSFERLWKWRREGRFAGGDLSLAFYAKFAKAATRAGEPERARGRFDAAGRRFPPSADYYSLVLDYAEFHRKQGETTAAAALLAKRLPGPPPPLPRGVERGGRGGPRGSYAVVRAAPGRPGRRDPAGGALPVRLRPVPDRPARRGDRRVRSGGKGRVRHGGGRAASVLEGAGATRCRQGDGGGAGLRGTGRGRGRAGLRALRGV